MPSLKALRLVAVVEATSFLALLVATIVKSSGNGATGVQILGPIHGLLFLSYVYLTLTVRAAAGWSTKTTLLILLGSVLPFGGYVVDRTILAADPSDEPAAA